MPENTCNFILELIFKWKLSTSAIFIVFKKKNSNAENNAFLKKEIVKMWFLYDYALHLWKKPVKSLLLFLSSSKAAMATLANLQ